MKWTMVLLALLALAAYKGDAGRIKNDKNDNAAMEQDVEDSSQGAQHVEGSLKDVEAIHKRKSEKDRSMESATPYYTFSSEPWKTWTNAPLEDVGHLFKGEKKLTIRGVEWRCCCGGDVTMTFERDSTCALFKQTYLDLRPRHMLDISARLRKEAGCGALDHERSTFQQPDVHVRYHSWTKHGVCRVRKNPDAIIAWSSQFKAEEKTPAAKVGDEIKKLEASMNQAAKDHHYTQASELQEMIQKLKPLQEEWKKAVQEADFKTAGKLWDAIKELMPEALKME